MGTRRKNNSSQSINLKYEKRIEYSAASVKALLMDDIDEALDQLGERMVSYTKRHTPVRKLFKSPGSKRTRYKLTTTRGFGKVVTGYDAKQGYSLSRKQSEFAVKTRRPVGQGWRQTARLRTAFTEFKKSPFDKKPDVPMFYMGLTGKRSLPEERYLVYGAYDQLSGRGRQELRRAAALAERNSKHRSDSDQGGGQMPWDNIDERHSALTVVPIPSAREHRQEAQQGKRSAVGKLIGPGKSGGGFGKTFTLSLGGRLRNSINQVLFTDGSMRGVRVGTDVVYAKYVEFGTMKHGKAQPFLRPTLLKFRAEMVREIADNMPQQSNKG